MNIPKNSSSYPDIVAEFIESGEHGGTVKAIAYMTRKGLISLKDEHRRKAEEERIISEARIREARIFSILDPNIDDGTYDFILTRKVKAHILPIILDILWLYKYRMGESAMLELKRLLESKKDESMELVLAYEKDEKGVFYIKKISLKTLQ